MRLLNEVKWKRTIRWLRRCFPVPPHHVVVRRVADKVLNGEHGETAIYTDGRFVIFINMNKALCGQMDTILHEWAHLLSWFKYGGEHEDHTSEWGVLYARLYREHEKWNFGRKRNPKRKPLPGQREFAFTNEEN